MGKNRGAMQMENKNKEKVLTIIGVMTLLLFGVGATFAYFVAQDGNAEQTNINVTTHTTDSLVFEVGKAISITADQTTFAPGAGNRADSTFARATLKANSSTNSATEHYYVYLAIDTNEFKYTTDTKTAELILTVNYKDNSGNITPVTSINGLNYVTVGDISGFDITEEQNLITIANNYEVTSTGTTIDEWDITLTLVNLESNQNANTGKTFNATLLIQKEESFAGHIVNLHVEDESSNGLYFHNGTHIALTDLNDISGNLAFKTGEVMDANDLSYRYSGSNPSNYVCFGSDAEVCPYDNLYRVIGVFGLSVKLIKADYAGEGVLGKIADDEWILDSYDKEIYKGKLSDGLAYYWSGSDSNESNDWALSTLNTDVLNNSYLTLLGDKWTNLIDNHAWQIGGDFHIRLRSQPAKVFSYEIINPVSIRVINAKVGLMYLSDYGFACSFDFWHYRLSQYNEDLAHINNWLGLGLYESTITPNNRSEASSDVLYIDNGGGIGINPSNDLYSIRPTFYLKPTVTFAGGTGTETDPYRIA